MGTPSGKTGRVWPERIQRKCLIIPTGNIPRLTPRCSVPSWVESGATLRRFNVSATLRDIKTVLGCSFPSGLPATINRLRGRGVWMHQNPKTVLLPKPRGFCAGVIRAIDIVEIALERLGAPIYVRKEIVHNRFVVEDLAARGAVFVEDLSEVPDGAVAIFSAHGVAPDVRDDADRRKLCVIDATCPLVTKVHIEVVRYAKEGYSIILIGHRNHDEVIGTFGEAPNHIHVVSSVEDVDALENVQPERVIYATQTTLSIDDAQAIVDRLKQRFPSIISPASSDICYATQNRQTAVKALAD